MPEWFISTLKFLAGGAGAFFIKWAWDRYWTSRDRHDQHATEQLRTASDRIIVVEKKLEGAEAREGERSRTLGRLEGEIQRLDGKIGGLQDFWRTKFEDLEKKIDHRLEAFRGELRADQYAHEQRQAQLLSEHQHRVHDRLNEASAAQAQMLNELVDKLVDRAGE